MNLRILAYLRVSSEPQSRDPSLEEQKGEIERHYSRQGDGIAKWFIDVESAMDPRKQRQRFQDLLTTAKAGQSDVITCWRFDRLIRSWRDAAGLKEVLDDNPNLALEGVNQHLDKQILAMHLFLAEQDTETRRERFRLGRYGKARRGKFPGGKAPYGFKIVPENPSDRHTDYRLVHDPVEAAIYARIFEDSFARIPRRELARRLNREGKPTRHGGPWSPQYLTQLLRSETAKGIWKYGKTRWANYRRLPPAEPIEVPVQPIVSEELWDKVQRILDCGRPTSPRNTRHVYPTQGLLLCGKCGRRFVFHTVYSNGRPYRYAWCLGMHRYGTNCRKPKGISLLKLDRVVQESIAEAFKNPVVLDAAAERWLYKVARSEEELKVKQDIAEKELQQCDLERHRVITLHRKGKITEDDLDLQLRTVREQKEYWEEKMRRLEEAASAPKELQRRAEAAKAITEQVKDRLDKMIDLEWRNFLKLVVNRIVIDSHNNLEIELALPIEPVLPPETFAVYKTNHQ